MGIYLNPGNSSFEQALRSRIYVDKTGLLEFTNEVLGTEQKNICVSRPRRFGKSMAANMLVAYYSKGCDSRQLFEGLTISCSKLFEEHLNKYHVFFWNMQRFLSRAPKPEEMTEYLQTQVLVELKEQFPKLISDKETHLVTALEKLYSKTQEEFIFVIDEWDCVFREEKKNIDAQLRYLDFLRDLLKGQQYVKMAYMTGILPIKKYGTHSALNMFDEYSMTDPSMLAEYVGFTEQEVRELCEQYQVDFSETRSWYDGYVFEENLHIYNPKSVVDAMRRRRFGSYWTQTETYEALKIYIVMNFDGLKDAIISMIGGGTCRIDTGSFQNDMTTFHGRDEVLTLLIHLGYLAYDIERKEVYIPNEEVREEFIRAVKKTGWDVVIQAITDSEDLLEATLNGREREVAERIDKIHMQETSILTYNNENALSCVISIAYYSARNYYTLIREVPTGKGFADIVFLPRKKHADKMAMVIELKWDKTAKGAIDQIKNKEYMSFLSEYQGQILLVGINYDKESKKHQCRIEKI